MHISYIVYLYYMYLYIFVIYNITCTNPNPSPHPTPTPTGIIASSSQLDQSVAIDPEDVQEVQDHFSSMTYQVYTHMSVCMCSNPLYYMYICLLTTSPP
jgi:hypothetical protein